MTGGGPEGKIREPKPLRLLLASSLCGPIAGAVVALAYSAAVQFVAGDNGSGLSIASFVLFVAYGAGFGAVIGWPAMLFLGIAVHLMLYRAGKHGVGDYLLPSTIIGAGLAVLLCLLWTGLLLLFGILSFIGAPLAAYIFWLIRRPDRDAKAPETPPI